MKKIAIIDPSSYTLPYDYFYLIEVSKYYKIDFYYSKTKYNYEYIDKLRSNNNIRLIEYNISSSVIHKSIGLLNYIKMLTKILIRKNSYSKIHFMWNIYMPVEQIFFKLFGDKFIFTYHNNVPHSFKEKVFKPYQKINTHAVRKVFVSEFTKNEFIKSYENIGEYYLLNHGLMPISEFNETNNIAKGEIDDSIYFWGRVEEYKGIDVFKNFLKDYQVKIYGKWNINLLSLKDELSNKENIEIIDSYLPNDDLKDLLERNNIFILPYKDATQSGVLYTLLAYKKVFICSDVGENSKFLNDNGLDELIFDRADEKSIVDAFEFAKRNYKTVKEKLSIIKDQYKWEYIMTEDKIKELYE
jgi:hypothetical protein